jgi:hypothetical protein
MNKDDFNITCFVYCMAGRCDFEYTAEQIANAPKHPWIIETLNACRGQLAAVQAAIEVYLAANAPESLSQSDPQPALSPVQPSGSNSTADPSVRP